MMAVEAAIRKKFPRQKINPNSFLIMAWTSGRVIFGLLFIDARHTFRQVDRAHRKCVADRNTKTAKA